MRAKDILGKRVLRVDQTSVKTNSGRVQNLDRIVFEDGTVLIFNVSETETEYAVYGTVFKKPLE